MDEILLLMLLLFAAYLFLPKSWLTRFAAKPKPETVVALRHVPEDSVLRRHYITQLRSEIVLELYPRPSDSTLQRHYDALVETELENRLATLSA
ncbi:MAG: hypothetical protein PHW13_06195 [Methylococcales bacterium]|nr:hypothetical protein [Methylococcales bacterium]